MKAFLKNINHAFAAQILLMLFFSRVCLGAEITVLENKIFGVSPAISISGEFVKGDFEKFTAAAKEVIIDQKYRGIEVYLNSPGGDASEAMKIGRMVRKLLAKTFITGTIYYDPKSLHGIEHAQWIANNTDKISNERKFVPFGKPIPEEYITKCYSACVLVFVAGVEKYANNNGYFRNPKYDIPVIGLHRPFYEKSYYSNLTVERASSAYDKLVNEISSYLKNMNAPENVIEEMLKTPSTDISLVDSKTFKEYFPSVEPFLEEWLLAKCGETTYGKGLVEESELNYFNEINNLREKEAQKYGENELEKYADTLMNYWPEDTGISEIFRYEKVSSLIKRHNKKVSTCRVGAISNHQKNWAMQN